jgi:hypothetical protein
METPMPTAGHLKLEKLAGHWVGKETMHPSQWDPSGGIAIGRTRSRLALNGFALISEYEQERDGNITYSGHGVFSFEPKNELYLLHWFDSMGSPPELFVGKFAGDRLVVGHEGPKMHARLTYDLADPRCMRTKMEMSPDGAVWNTLFEARYERT